MFASYVFLLLTETCHSIRLSFFAVLIVPKQLTLIRMGAFKLCSVCDFHCFTLWCLLLRHLFKVE